MIFLPSSVVKEWLCALSEMREDSGLHDLICEEWRHSIATAEQRPLASPYTPGTEQARMLAIARSSSFSTVIRGAPEFWGGCPGNAGVPVWYMVDGLWPCSTHWAVNHVILQMLIYGLRESQLHPWSPGYKSSDLPPTPGWTASLFPLFSY